MKITYQFTNIESQVDLKSISALFKGFAPDSSVEGSESSGYVLTLKFEPHQIEEVEQVSKIVVDAFGTRVSRPNLLAEAWGVPQAVKVQIIGADLFDHSSFTVVFSEDLSPEQVRGTLEALADYFRACGGAGFEIDFEYQDVRDGALVNA